jgi:hypothetical protein
MELETFEAHGLRPFGPLPSEIPLRKPTILTGGNAGGKTTALAALSFLLTGRPVPTLDDRTNLYEGELTTDEVADAGSRYASCTVVGTFSLSPEEQAELGVASTVKIRRVSTEGRAASLQVMAIVPLAEDLRSIETLGHRDLRERAEGRGINPIGNKASKETWRAPLAALAEAALAAGDVAEEWIDAPKAIQERMPRFLLFSSTNEPEPEREIQTALRVVFRALLEDPKRLGPVRTVEEELQQELVVSARDLCELIVARCSELGQVVIEPEVSFSEGFGAVSVFRVLDDGKRVGLQQSGAGRRRQVNLAVWEWTQRLLDVEDGPTPIVIAYDEPDTHLDYHHQRELMELIRRQAGNGNVRMIVATHSLNLIDRVPVEDIVHLRLDENERTIVERLMLTDHEETNRYLARVATAMGLRNSVLLHERCFVGVEGPTELQALPVLFWVATGSLLQSAGIALISGGNNVGALQVAKYLHDSGRIVAFVVDRDSITNARRVFQPDKLKGAGFTDAQINFVGMTELEDLFPDDQWAVVANTRWPRNDGNDWTPAHFAPLRSDGKFSGSLLEILRNESDRGPNNKPEILGTLALSLSNPEDVPEELRALFTRLIELAQ